MHCMVGNRGRAPGSRGWSRLVFTPAFHDHAALTSANASVATPLGAAAIAWAAAPGGQGTAALTVPPGATATLVLPGATAGVTEGGAPVWAGGAFVPGVPGVTGAALVGGALRVELGSGEYAFAAV